MKIAFNPSTVAALTTPPDNKDITFDLRGHNIFARGVKFYGTDTNTWRDIKINNVSIGSNVLDLRNGSNTTLTNTDGVVTINSTWRPVVDNLTSNSTTSSLSANQGRVLAGLINGKSDSDHNHDDRYVKKSGDTMSGVLTINTTNFGTLIIKRNDDTNGASIQFRGKSNVYGYIGLNSYSKDKQFLRWDSEGSKIYTILDTSSTYTSNGKGIINGTTITQVDNATNATNSINANKLVNWYSTRPTSLNAQFGDGSLRIFYATSSTTKGKCPENAAVLHLAWDNIGGWDSQLAISSPSNRVYVRSQNVGTWQPWKTLAFTTDIPDKNSWNYDDRYYTKAKSNAKYITDITTSVNKLTFTRNGSNIARNITVNVVYSQGQLPNIPNEDATTKASPGLLIYDSCGQAIGTNIYSSVLSINTGGTIQIAGNWGDDYAKNLYWRSQSDRNVTEFPWKSWRTILDSENYSFTLDSRYYTESEVNSLLDAKLNRQNLSYGNWNPRGQNLAADYHYNGGDLSISENNGKMYVSVDGCFWQNEGQYRVLDTSDIGNIRNSVTLHQYLSATDAAWYPLVWGRVSHNNTRDSTGPVYKSHDKLSWQTSSQTLYATNILTNNIKGLSIGGGIYWNPYVEPATDGSDAASITLVRSGVAGGTTLVLSQQNDTNDTIQFQTNPAARLYHNSYPILTTQNTYVNNNKGYINGTEITQVNNSDTVDGEHASAFTRIVGRHSIYTSETAPYNYIHLFRIANSLGYSTLDCEIDFRTRYHSAKLEIRISTAQYPYNSGGTSISIVNKVVSGRSCKFWFLPTIRSSNYNYYDVYYESGTWNQGSYGITSKGNSGILVFEHKGTNLTSLPDKVTEVTNQWVSWDAIAGKPSSFTPSAHSHPYLPLSGGTLTGALTIDFNHSGGGTNFSLLNVLFNGTHDYGIVAKFHSYGNAAPAIRFSHSSNKSEYNSQVNTNWSVGMRSNTYTDFAITQDRGTSDWGTVRFSINNSGNVGIGTTSPTQKLDVAGNIRATGQLYLPTNGNYNAILMGDNCWLGDCNIGDVIGLSGRGNANAGGIKFGKGGMYIGYNGSSHYSSGTSLWTNFNADLLDGEHASNFSYTHQSSFDFRKIKSGRVVTFDQSNTAYGWINGFASTYNNYLTSVIFNTHRTSNWYVGYINGNSDTGTTNGLQAVHRLAFADGDASYPIFLGYLRIYNGNDGTIASSFPCLGYTVPFTYTRGGPYCLIKIPDTSSQIFYIKAAIASVHYSGTGMGNWVGNHRGEGAWWLHCYAVSNNAVQVKGFHLSNGYNDSWWGGNPLYSGNAAARIITVCLFGHVTFI